MSFTSLSLSTVVTSHFTLIHYMGNHSPHCQPLGQTPVLGHYTYNVASRNWAINRLLQCRCGTVLANQCFSFGRHRKQPSQVSVAITIAWRQKFLLTIAVYGKGPIRLENTYWHYASIRWSPKVPSNLNDSMKYSFMSINTSRSDQILLSSTALPEATFFLYITLWVSQVMGRMRDVSHHCVSLWKPRGVLTRL